MENTRERYTKRLESLRKERSSWLAHWQELIEFLYPRRGRFVLSDRNNGAKKTNKIINNSPTHANGVLGSGMATGMTPSSRPWFLFTTRDPDLAEYEPVKQWLNICQERVRRALIKSNVYKALHEKYLALGGLGTAVGILEEDTQDVVRAYVVPVGQYFLASSARGIVDTLYREFSMTVGQVVEMFGEGNCSQTTREAYREGKVDNWVEVCHAIEPNRSFDPGRADAGAKAFSSTWLEKSCNEEMFLRQSGYEENPILAPRWWAASEDVYGADCPGMTALGDIKALQQYEKRKAELVDKASKPPMKGPSSLRRASLVPGDITHVDTISGSQSFEPAMKVEPGAIEQVREDIRDRITLVNSAFHTDMWLMLAQTDRRNITAREVAERHEEKMLQLGPVVERMTDELHAPLIRRTFAALWRRGDIPPPPPEMAGMPLGIDFISIMAQAQKLLGITSLERMVGFVGSSMALEPRIKHKLNWPQMVDEYADMLGLAPDLVVSDEKYEEAVAAEAKAQEAAMAAQAATQAVDSASTLAGASMDGDTALNRLVNNLGPVAAATTGVGS